MLNQCLLMLQLFVGFLCVCSLLYNTLLSGPLMVAIIALRERGGAICFDLIVYLLSCGFWCSKPLPRGAVGWTVICDIGISWSYALAFRH